MGLRLKAHLTRAYMSVSIITSIHHSIEDHLLSAELVTVLKVVLDICAVLQTQIVTMHT